MKTNAPLLVMTTLLFLLMSAHTGYSYTTGNFFDQGQTAHITVNVISGATPPYTYNWLVQAPGTSAFSQAPTSTCATNSGTVMTENTPVTCVFSTNTQTQTGIYAFELYVTDSVNSVRTSSITTIAVNSMPSVSTQANALAIDIGQSSNIASNVVGGTGTFSYQWYNDSTGSPVPISGATSNSLTVQGKSAGTFSYNVVVNDIGTVHPFVFNSPAMTISISNGLTLGTPNVIISNSIIDVGQTATLSANVVGGAAPFTYQWYNNTSGSVAISGATSNMLSVTGGATGVFTYNVVVKDQNSQTSAGSGTVTVNNALGFGSPTVTIPNSMINVGQNEIITANVVGGSKPYSFKWFLNGNQLGQTSNSITFNGNSSDVGSDSINVIVTDNALRTASASGTVNVNSALSFGTPNVIIPNSVIDSGQSETIVANVVGGTSPFTYNWLENGNPVIDNSNTLTFTGTASGANTITVTVKDSSGQSSTASGAITVNNALSFSTPNVIISNSVIGQGQTATATANIVGGTPPYTYGWALNGNTLGQTGNTITINGNLSDVGTDHVTVTATDSRGQSSSATGTITVSSGLSFGTPSIIIPNSNIDVGQSENVIANVVGGALPYTFSWAFNNNPVAGTTNTVRFTATAVGTNTVSVTVTDRNGQTANALETITVNNGIGFGAPNIMISNNAIDQGQTTTLTANVIGGTSPYTFQWYNTTGSPVAIPGATSNTFSVIGGATGTFTYNVVVTDNTGQTSAAGAKLIVNTALSIGAPQPSVQTIDQTQNAIITEPAPATGTSPYSYSWRVETPGNSFYISASGMCAPSNTATCNFPTSTSTTTGTYYFEANVIDSAGSTATSPTAQVNVNPQLSVGQPTVDPIDQGQTANIIDYTPTSGTAPYSYNWLVEVPGSNSYALAPSWICPVNSGSGQAANTPEKCSFTTNTATNTGTYSFIFQVTDSSATPVTTNSASAPVGVNTLPVVTFSVSPNTLTVNQISTLTANVQGGTGPFTVNFVYSNGTVANTVAGVSANSIATYAFNAFKAGTFTFNAVAVDTGVLHPLTIGSGSASVKANPAVLSVSVSPATANADVGQALTFNAIVTGGTSPYTYSWTFNSNAISCSATCSFTATNSGTLNVIVTDSSSPIQTANSASSLAIVGNALSASASPSSSTVSRGGSQLYSANVVGGSGSFSYQWYNDTSGTPSPVSGATSNTFDATGGAGGTFTYNVVVTDLLTTIPDVASSSTVSFTVTIVPSPPGNGGGVSGGGGGGGGSRLPTVLTTAGGSCQEITNFSTSNYEIISVKGQPFRVTVNFITPTSAGVTVNSSSFTLPVNQITNITTIGNTTYYLNLINISYLPIQHTITLDVCSSGTGSTAGTSGAPGSRIPTATNSLANRTGSNSTQSGFGATVSPAFLTANSGTRVTFTSNVFSGSGTYTYQWYNATRLNAAPVQGAVSGTLSFITGKTGLFQYYLDVTDTGTGRTAKSNIVSLSVQPASNTLITSGRTSTVAIGALPSIVPGLIAVIAAILIGYMAYSRRNRQPPPELGIGQV